jgi:hypothetical protein
MKATAHSTKRTPKRPAARRPGKPSELDTLKLMLEHQARSLAFAEAHRKHWIAKFRELGRGKGKLSEFCRYLADIATVPEQLDRKRARAARLAGRRAVKGAVAS